MNKIESAVLSFDKFFNQYPAAVCFALFSLLILVGIVLVGILSAKRKDKPLRLKSSDVRYVRI